MLKSLLPKSDFTKNVLTLMTGTGIAQAIPLLISPVLARLYTTADFGLLSIFLSVASILGTIACGRYELAIMLPKKDEDAINVMALGFIILVAFAVILSFVVLLFNTQLVIMLDNEAMAMWLYWIPITVFLTGFFKLLTYFNNRQKYYKDIATATVIRSVVLASVQLVVVLIKSGAYGLIGGQIVSQFSANMRLLKNIIKDKALTKSVKKLKMIALAKLYGRFPKYDLWSSLLNVSATHIPTLLIADYFSVGIVGLYGFAFKVITRPATLVGASISQVFYQSSASLKDEQEDFKQIVLSTYKKLVLLSAIPFAILGSYSDYIFAFVFGKPWIDAGVYTQIMTPWLFLAFIFAPLSTVLLIRNRQDVLLKANVVLFVTRVLSVVIGGYLCKDIVLALVLLSGVSVFVYAYLIFFILRLSHQNFKGVFLYSIKYVLLILVIALSRYLINVLFL